MARRKVFRRIERALLGLGMTVIAFFIERRLIKAIKTGGVQAAPRTAADSDEFAGGIAPTEQTGEITTRPQV